MIAAGFAGAIGMRGGLILRTAVVALGGLGLAVAVGGTAASSLRSATTLPGREEILSAYEKNSIDTTACRKHKPTWSDPNAGYPACLEPSMRDIARKLQEGAGSPD